MVQDKDAARQERLKAALRDNLKRRKAQNRARSEGSPRPNVEHPAPIGRDEG